jgi:hypothetical protein
LSGITSNSQVALEDLQGVGASRLLHHHHLQRGYHHQLHHLHTSST